MNKIYLVNKKFAFSTKEKAEYYINNSGQKMEEFDLDINEQLKLSWVTIIRIQDGYIIDIWNYYNTKEFRESRIDKGAIVTKLTGTYEEAVNFAREVRGEFIKGKVLPEINPYDWIEDSVKLEKICVNCKKKYLGNSIRNYCKVCVKGKELAYNSNCIQTEY